RPSAPDLVQRAFRAERPDQLWVADMTQNTPTRAGCTSPSSLTLSRGVSSAGPWVSARWLTCQSERSVWPSGTVDPTQVSFITPIMDHSTPRLPLEKPYVKLGL